MRAHPWAPGRRPVKRPRTPDPSFGPIPAGSGVPCVAKAHDLRRAWTRIDPNHLRRKGVGRGDAHLAAGGGTGGTGAGRRLRLRLDGPGRHPGGGGRRRPLLADSPAVPGAHADTYADSHTHTHTHTHTHSNAPAAEAEALAPAEARTQAHAHPHAETAASPRAARPAAPEREPDAPTRGRTAPGPHADTGALGAAQPASPRGPCDLSALPGAGAHGTVARQHLTDRLRPAHHGARRDRRRRPAGALIPGGNSCRNGLFSPSRCWPHAPW